MHTQDFSNGYSDGFNKVEPTVPSRETPVSRSEYLAGFTAGVIDRQKLEETQ